MMSDPKEIQLISALRKNARASLAKISEILQVPKSTVFDRLKRHEHGIIHNTPHNYAIIGVPKTIIGVPKNKSVKLMVKS